MIFSKSQCGFTAKALMLNITWQKNHCNRKITKLVDGGGHTGALLTNFSKTDHKLLKSKLYVYSFDKNFLVFIYSYLKGKKQKPK